MDVFWRRYPVWGLAIIVVLLIGCQTLAGSQPPVASPTRPVSLTAPASPAPQALSTTPFKLPLGTTAILASPPTPTLALSSIPGLVPTAVEQVPRITPQKLKQALDAGEAVVIVDARPLDSYNQRHIAGALSVPLDEIERRHDELPKDKDVVLYCT